MRLVALLQQLRDEVSVPAASPMFVRSVGQALAVHLARNYAEVSDAKRANESSGDASVTIILAEGVYSLSETVVLKPKQRTFTREQRLTIRAEVLPDNPEWNIGRMPTLVVDGENVSVSVDGAEKPALSVKKLNSRRGGRIGLTGLNVDFESVGVHRTKASGSP